MVQYLDDRLNWSGYTAPMTEPAATPSYQMLREPVQSGAIPLPPTNIQPTAPKTFNAYSSEPLFGGGVSNADSWDSQIGNNIRNGTLGKFPGFGGGGGTVPTPGPGGGGGAGGGGAGGGGGAPAFTPPPEYYLQAGLRPEMNFNNPRQSDLILQPPSRPTLPPMPMIRR